MHFFSDKIFILPEFFREFGMQILSRTNGLASLRRVTCSSNPLPYPLSAGSPPEALLTVVVFLSLLTVRLMSASTLSCKVQEDRGHFFVQLLQHQFLA